MHFLSTPQSDTMYENELNMRYARIFISVNMDDVRIFYFTFKHTYRHSVSVLPHALHTNSCTMYKRTQHIVYSVWGSGQQQHCTHTPLNWLLSNLSLYLLLCLFVCIFLFLFSFYCLFVSQILVRKRERETENRRKQYKNKKRSLTLI